jgi:hypothetical protein
MADNPQLLASITAALPQHFSGPVRKQINRRSTLLRVLRVVRGAGKNVAFDVEADGAVAENFGDGDDAANFGSDALNPATLGWAQVRANFRVGNVALRAAQSSQNGMRLLARNFMSSAGKLASLINTQCFTGNGSSNSIVGLTTAIHDSNTYAGINRATGGNEYWRSMVADAATAPLSLAMIRQDIGATIFDASGMEPDIAFVGSATYLKIGALFQETRRDVIPATEITTSRGRVMLDGGIGAIRVDNTVFIKDKDCPASQIIYCNSDAMELEYLPSEDEEGEAGTSELDADDGLGPIPLGFKCYPLGRQGASRRFSTEGVMQLKLTQPNAFGRRINFT